MYQWSNKSVKEAGDEKPGVCGRGGGGGGRSRGSSAVEDEGSATLRRAFLVQKWMDMKVNAKNFTHRRRASSLPEYSHRKSSSVIENDNDNDTNDPFFFNHSISGYVSGSTGNPRSHKPSCFRPFGPKPIKTEPFPERNRQPVSPGRRLTAFLNSLFTNVYRKPKDLDTVKIERSTKPTLDQSTCSSASSFTRSCLSKNSPRSREKLNNGVRRSVRFYPVSVIIDEDCRPCGEKFICGEQDFMKVHVTCENRFDDEDEGDYNDNDNDNDDDDVRSDVSSDLFELDHLSILKDCDELPVYGTTHFGTNRAIANGLIC